MIKIEIFSLGPLQTNCYVLINELEGNAIVIDPGMNPKSVMKRIESLKVEAILLTHAHFDHIGGVDEIRKWKQCPVYIHPLEAEWLTNADLNGSTRWTDVTDPIDTELAEFDLGDGQILSLIGESIKVMHTPGHSPGSVSFFIADRLFSGDVIFRHSVGRTDLPGGNFRQLHDSIHLKLFKLPGETIVYPGHGPKTTIAYEQQHNPYV